MEKKERKPRCDKKVDVKPTIPVDLKHHLYTFAQLTHDPVKDVCERFIIQACLSKHIIEPLSRYMRRNYVLDNHVFIGQQSRPRLKVTVQSKTEKVSLRMQQPDYDLLCDLAYAMDCTPTTVSAILLKYALYDIPFIQEYAKNYLMGLDPFQQKKVDHFLNTLWKEKKHG